MSTELWFVSRQRGREIDRERKDLLLRMEDFFGAVEVKLFGAVWTQLLELSSIRNVFGISQLIHEDLKGIYTRGYMVIIVLTCFHNHILQ